MAAVRKYIEQDQPLSTPSVGRGSVGKPKPALTIADDQMAARASPVHMLQAELQRALSPGPVAPDRFSKRRAMKFIGPASAGFGLFVLIINHIGHH